MLMRMLTFLMRSPPEMYTAFRFAVRVEMWRQIDMGLHTSQHMVPRLFGNGLCKSTSSTLTDCDRSGPPPPLRTSESPSGYWISGIFAMDSMHGRWRQIEFLEYESQLEYHYSPLLITRRLGDSTSHPCFLSPRLYRPEISLSVQLVPCAVSGPVVMTTANDIVTSTRCILPTGNWHSCLIQLRRRIDGLICILI